MCILVTGAVEEPAQGWISPGSTISSVSIGVANGLVKVIPANAKNKADLVPVDYVVNAMIIAAYKTAKLG